MKTLKARHKIALLVGGSVLAALLIILILFNAISRSQLDSRARASLENFFTLEDDGDTSYYSPQYIEVTDETFRNYKVPSDSAAFLKDMKDREIIEYVRDNDITGPCKVELQGGTYYIMKGTVSVPDLFGDDGLFNDEFYELFDGIDELFDYDGDGDVSYKNDISELDDTYEIAYIDVTGEQQAITRMSIFFLIAAVVTGLFGSIEGFFIGRKLERNQLAQKQFFENTSHELKTPLTSIRGYAEGIETGVITDYQKTGRVITAQTEKMSALVEEILLMAKLDSGAMPLKKEPTELASFVENCLMPLEGAVMSRGLAVTLRLTPRTVSADPDRLDHAVSNLLTNALKYAKTFLRITLDDRMLSIENDCEAISDDELSHLFERFYTGRNGNTGIGLALAKEIIELHGWRITAERTAAGIRFAVMIS